MSKYIDYCELNQYQLGRRDGAADMQARCAGIVDNTTRRVPVGEWTSAQWFAIKDAQEIMLTEIKQRIEEGK